jgi:hypothetical protein
MNTSASKAIRKYLQRWAEPEARVVPRSEARFAQALVVPLCDEEPSFMQGLLPALRAQPDTLLIVVVNATAAAAASTHQANARLLRELCRGGDGEQWAPGVHLQRGAEGAVLWIDRCSAGRHLPPREGVGLARKIGCDVALAACQLGVLHSPWIATTDADVTLPADYFARFAEVPPATAAVCFDFAHQPCEDAALSAATLGYEAYLRYYVLGLHWAGSPYAFHSLGSCLGVHAEYYAQGRGFPRRLAGEDFHLLAKLAKLAPVQRLQGVPIEIRSRRSARAPFGTGARVHTLLDGSRPLLFHDPDVFEVLQRVLQGLEGWAERAEDARFQNALDVLPAGRGRVCAQLLAQLGIATAFDHARELGSDAASRLRHLLVWFDALKTLRLLRALGGQVLPEVPWSTALARAPFLGALREQLAPCDDPALALAPLRMLETRLESRLGPSLG